jgi:hypothetical protein
VNDICVYKLTGRGSLPTKTREGGEETQRLIYMNTFHFFSMNATDLRIKNTNNFPPKKIISKADSDVVTGWSKKPNILKPI